jgi:hypothetical protein
MVQKMNRDNDGSEPIRPRHTKALKRMSSPYLKTYVLTSCIAVVSPTSGHYDRRVRPARE